MLRLLVSRRLPDRVMDTLAAEFDTTCRATTLPMDAGETRAALADYDAILPTLGDAFAASAFAGPIRTRILANFGVGYNHIDVTAARRAGVAVTNTPGAVTEATADVGLMLLLMTARRASEGERLVRAGLWQGWHPTQMLGVHLGGRRLGIIGMGRIGKAIARRAHLGLGMQVQYFNRSHVPDPGVPARACDSLAQAMDADAVAIAVPAGPQTRHLIDASALAAMPRHAFLINISRGDVIDETALIAALEAGRIAGAGLDVYEHEPHVPAGLRAMENVVLLPHLGTAALDVREAMGMMVVENLRAFAAGRDLPNPV
jgi:lactate dehydrogenase-like 2-hydroxyacid dehydrogenase